MTTALKWAKFPTLWLNQPHADPRTYPLAETTWRDFRMTGIAGLMILITLSLRLNEARKSRTFDRTTADENSVSVTWKDLQDTVKVASATVGKAISLLESWGAIRVMKQGRAARYELIGVEQRGGWCMLPQTFLEAGGDPVARFRELPATQLGLSALKFYVLILARRSTSTGTAALSFDTITKYTGIRREDLRQAWAFLHTQRLASVSLERDVRHARSGTDDQSQRYIVEGLPKSLKPDVDSADVIGEPDTSDYAAHL